MQTLKQNSYVRDTDNVRNNDGDTCIPRFHLETEAIILDGQNHFRDVEMVEIIMPGNPWNKPDIRVTDTERSRWPSAYKAFKEGQEAPVNGTPLEEWPVLTRSQVLTLKSLEFRSVEDIAGMNEYAIQRIGMGARQLKMKAMAYLDDGAKAAIVNRAIEQEERMTQALTERDAQIARLNEQLATLGDQMRQMAMNQVRASENVATTPGLAAMMGENVTPLRMAPAFSNFAKGVVDRAPDVAQSLQSFNTTGSRAPEGLPRQQVTVSLPGSGLPAKRRGRKSNAEKAAELAAMAGQNENQ